MGRSDHCQRDWGGGGEDTGGFSGARGSPGLGVREIAWGVGCGGSIDPQTVMWRGVCWGSTATLGIVRATLGLH